MNLKQLESAQKIYLQIGEVDKRIVELNHFAQNVAKGGQAKFSMNVEVSTQEKAPSVLDDEGFLKKPSQTSYEDFRKNAVDSMMRTIGIPGVIFEVSTQEKAPDGKNISGNVSETMALKIIAVILQDLTDQRQRLIKKLENLGIQTQ